MLYLKQPEPYELCHLLLQFDLQTVGRHERDAFEHQQYGPLVRFHFRHLSRSFVLIKR
jgi:hypothetical protein